MRPPRGAWLALLCLFVIALGCACLVLAFASERALPSLAPIVATPAASLTLTATAVPAASATPKPSATATATPDATATETAVPTDTPQPTAAPDNTATPAPPTSTSRPSATPAPARPPTNTPRPSGPSDILTLELASAALVGNLTPAKNTPPLDTKNCRWVQNNTRIGCLYNVFLPPGYYASTRRYAVVYLLHGWGGEYQEMGIWMGMFGKADAMMRSGEIPPFIMVAPEGDHDYWLNHAGDGERWSDYVASELVNTIDATYRTLAKRESRAIGGLSMGGLGAMQIALNHPDEFSLVAMRSPTLRRIGDPDTPDFFGDQSYYSRYDPFALAQVPSAVTRLKSYFIIGDADIWLGRTQEFRAVLDNMGAPYEWHTYPGEHDATFFDSHVEDDLRFFGANLAIR